MCSIICCNICTNYRGNNIISGSYPIEFQNGTLLVFVNPNSGSGQGIKIYDEELKPKLVGSKISHDLLITEYPNHAKQYIKNCLNLYTYNGIVIVSGDGLLFEVINGILERDDGEDLIQRIPFGICPAGSGNGLLASLYYYKNMPQKMPLFFENSIKNIGNLNTRAYPINLTHIQTDTSHFGSFLSIGWGLLADIDIESEKYRKILGSNRFALGAAIRVFGSLRSYKGKLSFLEAGPTESKDNSTYPVYLQEPITDDDCPSYKSHKSTISGSTITVDNYLSNVNIWKKHEKRIEKIPLINESIPDNWTTIEDEFLFVYITSLSHISPNNNYCPSAKLTDDRIHLTYVLKKDVKSKISLIKFLDSIPTSKHLEFDFCKSVSINSFRLEPIDKGSYIVVDGEVIDCTKIQGNVTDLNMYVMST